MPRSNIRLLTKEERKFFKDNYKFAIKEDVILVTFNGYGRIVAHPLNEDFSISSKIRKIKITKEAISLWQKKFQNTDFNVVDVQNAMNALIISYQGTDFNDVKNQLELIKQNDEKPII